IGRTAVFGANLNHRSNYLQMLELIDEHQGNIVFAELEPAMAARDVLQEAGLTVYVLPIFPGEGAGDALGYDLALGPRLQGAALWAQRETLKARFGYDGTLVYFRAVKPGSTP
ncbi:MAG: SPOR domain-containing protein, partial [Pseudomonadales bacterium]